MKQVTIANPAPDAKSRPVSGSLTRAVKRLFDFLAALSLLVLLAPLIGLLALVVLVDDGRPVFFRQNRVGRDGRHFRIFKFRTMRKATPNCATSELANPHSFITPSGRFLRKTSLDELPQLFNIILGQMSFVGPRPLIPQEENIHRLRQSYGVYRMRPGITGLAQVNGRDLVADQEKALMDGYYVVRHSLFMDAGILLRTVLVVLRADGVHEGKRPDSASAARPAALSR